MNWYHADLMESYYTAREVQEREAEAFSMNYDAELAEFYELNPRVTFRRWLVEYSASMGYREREDGWAA